MMETALNVALNRVEELEAENKKLIDLLKYAKEGLYHISSEAHVVYSEIEKEIK